jgi:hypothetical protein
LRCRVEGSFSVSIAEMFEDAHPSAAGGILFESNVFAELSIPNGRVLNCLSDFGR